MGNDNLLVMTRTELEQALQDSEMQEIIHQAIMTAGPKRRTYGPIIIERLFMWQRVNECIKREPE
jgi:hypothetical protein